MFFKYCFKILVFLKDEIGEIEFLLVIFIGMLLYLLKFNLLCGVFWKSLLMLFGSFGGIYVIGGILFLDFEYNKSEVYMYVNEMYLIRVF